MFNYVIMVGRLLDKPEIKELENGKKVANITLVVPRNFKNENGEYEKDFIDCILWNGIAENTMEYCNKGDVLGVKGRIETTICENAKQTNIIAEKVSFLSSSDKAQDE